MADTSTLVGEDHFKYIADRTAPEDRFLQDLKREAAAQGIPNIWIAPLQANFMQILLALARVRDVVEVGTLAGYSAISMARALPANGRVRTIEIEPKHADFAERWIEKSDVAGKIEVFRGSALEVLPRFEDDSADAAFLDADKENYPRYLEECMRIVRSGGLIMADNAFAFGELFEPKPREGVAAMRRFNDVIAKRRGLQAIIVPFGDGLWVARKE